MASQTVRDVNASTPSTQANHVRKESLDTKHTDIPNAVGPTQHTGPSMSAAKERDANMPDRMHASSTTTQTSGISPKSVATTHSTTTTTAPATANTATTTTATPRSQNEAVKASKPVGLKDELMGNVKKLTGTIVCSQSLKTKGEAQVEKGKQEVAAARAQKENLSPHFARDGNNGFLGGMESVAMQRMEEQERRALMGPRIDDEINAQFAQAYYQRGQRTASLMSENENVKSESENSARGERVEKGSRMNGDRHPLRENAATLTPPQQTEEAVVGAHKKSPRTAH